MKLFCSLSIFLMSLSVATIWCKNVPFLSEDSSSPFQLNLAQEHDENDEDDAVPFPAPEPESASNSVPAPVPVFRSSYRDGDRDGRRKKERRQVFREDLSPKLGGRIPSAALEWQRLMFNNLDSRGISVPDGWIPSTNDRVSSDESRIRYSEYSKSNPNFRDELSVPNIETTYTFPISLSMIGGLDAGGENTGVRTGTTTGYSPDAGDKSEEEKRKSSVMFSGDQVKIGDWDWDTWKNTKANIKSKSKKMNQVSDNVELRPFNSDRDRDVDKDEVEVGDRDRESQYQYQTERQPDHDSRQYQRAPHKVELHFFSPKDMENLETTYRDQIIDDIISRLKSSTTNGKGKGTGQNKRTGGKSNKNGGQTRTRNRIGTGTGAGTPSLLATTFSRMTQGNGRL